MQKSLKIALFILLNIGWPIHIASMNNIDGDDLNLSLDENDINEFLKILECEQEKENTTPCLDSENPGQNDIRNSSTPIIVNNKSDESLDILEINNNTYLPSPFINAPKVKKTPPPQKKEIILGNTKNKLVTVKNKRGSKKTKNTTNFNIFVLKNQNTKKKEAWLNGSRNYKKKAKE